LRNPFEGAGYSRRMPTPITARRSHGFQQGTRCPRANCPLPILKTKKALGELASGQVLKVVSTDAGSVKDMEAFAKQTGNELLGSEPQGKEYVFFLKKK
jgi:tRNA 2-thiouridine synthesizing protein A